MRGVLTQAAGESVSANVPVQRVLSKSAAAAYLGLTPRGFAEWVRLGRVPGPLPGTYRWDRVALDRHLDKLSGISVGTSEPTSQLKKWMEQQNGSKRL